MIKSLLAFSVFIGTGVMAQTSARLQIKNLPAYHPSGADIYIAGSFNGWNPRDTAYRFQRDSKGNYFIDLKLKDGSYEYKITRGGWDKGECGAGGRPVGNRGLIIPSGEVGITIEEWADRFPSEPAKSTASKNVQIIDTAFLIPQLSRTRKIWIYLPADYNTQNQKKYPVLYMHDGQNLFDNITSFSGEWGVDEFMDSTHLQPSIVVAIDHGAAKRVNEYNPYDNDRFGKGEGDKYLDFLVNTLKPYIDSHYRTLGDKTNTAIAGSSMGGLISMYAVLKYTEVFGSAGVLSPSFWLANDKISALIDKDGNKVNSRIYFYAGKMEGESIVPDATKAYEEMKKLSKSEVTLVVREDGKHNEATWRKEFPLFYQWLNK